METGCTVWRAETYTEILETQIIRIVLEIGGDNYFIYSG
jgi:hypothetical protein